MAVADRFQQFYRVMRHITRACMQDVARIQLSVRATSLVYATLLSTIPALAIGFSLLHGLGGDGIEPVLDELLAPLGEHKAAVQAQIIDFVDKVSAGALGYTGLVILVVTVLTLINKLEGALNAIWRVDEGRRWWRRITDYLSVLLLAPLLFAAAGSMASGVVDSSPGWLASWFSVLSSLALHMAAFLMFYLLLPNARVKVGAALVGALAASVMWYAAVYLFSVFASMASSYDAIYSSFAAMMLLLLWLELVWSIVLLGSCLAFYVQHPYERPWSKLRYSIDRPDTLDTAQNFHLLVDVAIALVADYQQPQAALSQPTLVATLSKRFQVPVRQVNQVLQELLQAQLFVETDERIVPARSPHTIFLQDVLGVASSYRGRGLQDVPLLHYRASANTSLQACVDALESTASDHAA